MRDVPVWAGRLRSERRARCWSSKEMVRRLVEGADEHVRAHLPSRESLARMVRMWEAGERRPRDPYPQLLARVFGVDERELFADPVWERSGRHRVGAAGELNPDDEERLTRAIRDPVRLDTAVVESLAATLASHRRVEDVIGSRAVLPAAGSHLDLVLRLLREARGPVGERLSAIASEASQFTGWLSTATGAYAAAGPLYDQALRLGLQAGDNDLAATGLSMRGHLAWVTGDIAAMAGLSQAAARLASAVGTRVVAIQQGARAMALLGDRRDALRMIDRAEDVLQSPPERDDPDGLYFYSADLLAMQRGLILAYLADAPAEHAMAADVIAARIEALPPAIRDSEWIAWYRVQAAVTRAAGGEVEESVAALRVALDTVSATGNRKIRADITTAHRSMARRWPGNPAVVELGEHLR